MNRSVKAGAVALAMVFGVGHLDAATPPNVMVQKLVDSAMADGAMDDSERRMILTAAEGCLEGSALEQLRKKVDGLPAVALASHQVASAPLAAMEGRLVETNSNLQNYCEPRCEPCRIWTASVEATYLKPWFDSKRAANDDDSGDFHYDVEAAPRITLGIDGCSGWGIRSRYWQYDAEADPIDTFEVVTGEGTEINDNHFRSELETYIIDVELTRRLCVLNMPCVASLGFRHGSVAHRFDSVENDVIIDDDVDTTVLDLRRRFDGVGITAGLEGRRPLRNGRLALLWNVRGSALWGDNKASRRSFDIDADGSADVDIDTASSIHNETLFIGEGQLGLEWSRPLRWGGRVFVRALAESQFWSRLGNPLPDVDSGPEPADSLGLGDFGFVGGTFQVGIDR